MVYGFKPETVSWKLEKLDLKFIYQKKIDSFTEVIYFFTIALYIN